MDLIKKLAAARAKRADLVKAAGEVLALAETESRANTPEEETKVSELHKQIEAEVRTISLLETQIEAERAKPTGAAPAAGGLPRVEHYVRYRTLRGFQKEEDAFRAGKWARALLFNDESARAWCNDNSVELRVASEGVFTKGGAIVPSEMSTAIIDLREQYGVARRLLRVMPMGSDTLMVPRRTGGVTAYFVGENAEVTASDKAWDQVQLSAKKLGALSKLSMEYAEDAVIDVAADLANEMAYAFAVKEDECWLNGDGTSTYGGMFGIRTKIIDGTHTAGAIDAGSNNDTFAEINADDILSVIGALPVYAEANAKWLVSKRGKALMFDALTSAAGGNNMMDLAGRRVNQYLGDEIVVSQAMPTVTTDLSNVAMALYGDFSLASTMGDRRGFNVMVLRERFAELGQVGVLGFERFDIVNHDLGSTTAAGPVVALIGE
jgi:HK97 family phage major capsid protein